MQDSGEKIAPMRQDRFGVVLDAGPPRVSTSTSENPGECKLPLERASYWERTHGWQVFLSQPVQGRLRNWTWRETMDDARRMAAFLIAQKWPPGSHIVILSKNCAWWILAELAIWMSGHVTVPIYTSVTNDWARRLFSHCRPVACFIGPLDNPDLLSEVPETILQIGFSNARARGAAFWDEIVRTTLPLSGTPSRSSNELATIIYTSGTTGPPKGAMHTFAAFPYFAKAVEQVIGTGRCHHRVISYLPLAHIAERALTETAGLYLGWRIFFCENNATFLRDVQRARPTVFFSVPRLYAKFQTGVLEKISAGKLKILLRIPLLGWVVRRRVLKRLGLHRVNFAASGSAPISADLQNWFRSLGLPLTEGYGTTETGITHTAPAGCWRSGSVGTSTPGVETRIASNGEIEIKSPMSMLGYYLDPASTLEVFTNDGYVRTGDLGEIDGAGWLKITGRIKEQFKTAKGKYVLPSAIERMLEVHEAIDVCVVIGSGLAAPMAVAAMSDEAQQLFDQQESRQLLEHSLEDLLEAVNLQLAPHERLSLIALTRMKWTIANGLLTPTLKLRRRALEAHYAGSAGQWLAQQKRVLWVEAD